MVVFIGKHGICNTRPDTAGRKTVGDARDASLCDMPHTTIVLRHSGAKIGASEIKEQAGHNCFDIKLPQRPADPNKERAPPLAERPELERYCCGKRLAESMARPAAEAPPS